MTWYQIPSVANARLLLGREGERMGTQERARQSTGVLGSVAEALGVSELLEQNLLGNAFVMQTLFATGSGEDVTGAPAATDFSSRAQTLFPQLDGDGDGYLGPSEIDAAVVDDSYTGADAAVVATLNRLGDELEELSNEEWGDENDGVTVADLQAYERTGTVSGGLRERVESRYAHGVNRINEGSSLLYGPTGTPSVQGVNQGLLKDCSFLAAVAAVVARSPATIQAMIADNLDGTYTVSFPDQAPQTVDGPTDAEIAQYAHSKGNGFWVTLLEKAYGQIQSPDAAIPNEGADTSIGELAAPGIAFLTGNSTNTDVLLLSARETTASRLTTTFDEGGIVTAGIRKAGPAADGTTASGLPMGHVYAVTAWDEGAETLTLYNPWGKGERTDEPDTADDGVFEMTLDDFLANFTTIAYEQG